MFNPEDFDAFLYRGVGEQQFFAQAEHEDRINTTKFIDRRFEFLLHVLLSPEKTDCSPLADGRRPNF